MSNDPKTYMDDLLKSISSVNDMTYDQVVEAKITGMGSITREPRSPLTEAERKQIETIVSMGDRDIDTSDIPSLTEAELKQFRRGVGRSAEPEDD